MERVAQVAAIEVLLYHVSDAILINVIKLWIKKFAMTNDATPQPLLLFFCYFGQYPGLKLASLVRQDHRFNLQYSISILHCYIIFVNLVVEIR